MIGFGTIRSIFQSCQFIIRNENSIALGWFHRYIFLERCLTSLHAVHSNRFTVSEETIVREEGIYDNTRVPSLWLWGKRKRRRMYEKRVHGRRSGWRSHEEERQHEARIMYRGYIYINRGKNPSLFTNWNNSILHARDLSFRDYASSSPRNIYTFVYTAIQVPTLAFLYYLGSFPRRKRYLSPLRGQCIICSFVISI